MGFGVFQRATKALGTCVIVLLLLGGKAALAQPVPGAADAARFQTELDKQSIIPQEPGMPSTLQGAAPSSMPMPAGADTVLLNLERIDLEGATAYSADELQRIWRDDIGKTVSLARIYEIAGAITDRYRSDGYFLSRAFIPQQEIKDGVVRIGVAEGYIQKVQWEGGAPNSPLIEAISRRLTSSRPISINKLERQMLLLNDLPGDGFKAVLLPMPAGTADRGGVLLVLIHPSAESQEPKKESAAPQSQQPAPEKKITEDLPAMPDLTEGKKIDSAGGTPPARLTLDRDLNVKVRFVSEGASYKDTLGMYTVGPDGSITNIELLAPNFSGAGTGLQGGGSYQAGDVLADIRLPKGAEIGFFLISNGYQLNRHFSAGDFAQGHFEFRNESELVGPTKPAEFTKDTRLVFIGEGGNVSRIRGQVFHASYKALNPDGAEHTVSGKAASGNLQIGFEDMKNQGDRDFNDAVIQIDYIGEPAPAQAALEEELPVAEDHVHIDTLLNVTNAGSRYLGPYLASAQFDVTGVLPFHKTSLMLNSSAGSDELRYASVSHLMPLNSNGLMASAQAAYTKGAPGHTLSANNIASDTVDLNLNLHWDIIRQRTENLRLTSGFYFLNTKTDTLGVPLSRDHLRIAKLGGHYDLQDRFSGATTLDLVLSQGLELFGASDAGDLNLSRAEGRPDFTKLELSVYRFQKLSSKFDLMAGLAGQISNGPLLSSQEFGYGGQSFGRAYDPSEIVGDSGFSTMAEVRYNILNFKDILSFQPFAFYDIGVVYNRDAGQPERQSAASAGGGSRFSLPAPGVSGSVTVAQPLTKRVDAPQYGHGKSPRIVFSLSADF
jgi:hemolysin activation/secretion protein